MAVLHSCQHSDLSSPTGGTATSGDAGRMGLILPSALILVADSKKSSSQGKLLLPSSCLHFLRGTDTAVKHMSSAFSRGNGGHLKCSEFWGAMSPPHNKCGQGPETAASNTDVSHPHSAVVLPYGLEVIWIHPVSTSSVRLESGPKDGRGVSAHLANGPPGQWLWPNLKFHLQNKQQFSKWPTA